MPLHPPAARPARRACALLVTLLFVLSAAARAADGELPAAAAHGLELVAPQGRWVTRVELRESGYGKRYDAQGNRQDLGASFDAVNLDAAAFPALAAFGPGASLGTTTTRSRLTAERLEIRLGYGLTDNLTVGVILPFGRTTNHIDFSVSGGNIGFNTAFNPAKPIGPTNFPLAPVGAGAATALDTQGVQAILSNPAFGLGYKPLRTTTTSGLSDSTAGFLWRFWHNTQGSATFGSGVRFGIQPENDPNNLADIPIDDGSTDVIGQLEAVQQLGAHWDMRVQAKRTIQTADHVTVRVPAPGELLPGIASLERVKRNMGDFWEYDLELGRVIGNWRVAGTWHRWDKASDHYGSDKGTNTSALNADTRILADQWRLSLSWSGISAWQGGHLPLPLIVKLETQQTYRGINMPDVYDYYLQFTSFF